MKKFKPFDCFGGAYNARGFIGLCLWMKVLQIKMCKDENCTMYNWYFFKCFIDTIKRSARLCVSISNPTSNKVCMSKSFP